MHIKCYNNNKLECVVSPGVDLFSYSEHLLSNQANNCKFRINLQSQCHCVDDGDTYT